MDWTRVEDLMPEYNETVIICNVNSVITAGWRTSTDISGEHWDDKDGRGCAVTHWMPLPDLPQKR